MWPILLAVYALSSCHGFIAMLSIGIGVASSLNADVWMAHRVAPIWSGAFYLITAVIGIICAKKRTVYLIMCFGATSVVSMVVSVVGIQLLRLGLVNHMSDGDTLRKGENDILVIMALATAGVEILVCLVSVPICYRVVQRTKKEVSKKNEGTFSITVLGEKDIVIKTTKTNTSYDKLSEHQTTSSESMGADVPQPGEAETEQCEVTQAMLPQTV